VRRVERLVISKKEKECQQELVGERESERAWSGSESEVRVRAT
jgi:hypothetical protein